MPPDESERLVKQLQKIGVCEVKLTLYPEARHDSWKEDLQQSEVLRVVAEAVAVEYRRLGSAPSS